MEPYVAPPRNAGGFGARAAAFAGVAGDARAARCGWRTVCKK